MGCSSSSAATVPSAMKPESGAISRTTNKSKPKAKSQNNTPRDRKVVMVQPKGKGETKSKSKRRRKVEDYYRIEKELGKGHFAKVNLCVNKETGQKCALKIIEKNSMVSSKSLINAEVNILKKLGEHPHIVAMLDTFETATQFFIVMELCTGGDLFSKIVEDGKYGEKQALRYCRELASALEFIHSKGITHRDLKPENILLTSNSLDASIKVADFGLAKLMREDQKVMKTVCGTWAYCAPEVINRKLYGPEVDVWTLGVLMFILLSGYHPFDVYGEMTEPELLDKIVKCEYDFNDPVWDGISTEAKDVIVKLLKPDPTDRISLKEFLGSPWIAKDTSSAENAVLVNRLKKFNLGRVKLRALILAKLASKKFINSRSNKKNKGGAGAFASDLASPRDGPASPTPHTEFDDVDTGREDNAVYSEETNNALRLLDSEPEMTGVMPTGTKKSNRSHNSSLPTIIGTD